MAQTKPVQSLLRGIDILQMLVDEPGGLRLNDIANAMGLKVPTVHNLVRTLVMRGMVEKLPSNHYAPSNRIVEMGYGVRHNKLYRSAEAAMRKLAACDFEPVVNYSVPTPFNLVVELRMSPDRPRVLQRPSGQTNGIYSSATGLAYQSFGPIEQVESLRQQFPFHTYGVGLWQSLDDLNAHVDSQRKQGYSVTPFAGQELYRLGFPVFDEMKDLIAIMGIAVPLRRVPSTSAQANVLRQVKSILKSLDD